MLVLVLCIYGALAYHKIQNLSLLFKGIQILQLLALTVGMLAFKFPFLIAFLFIIASLVHVCGVFLPDKWRSKQYFALLGASGAVFALVSPCFWTPRFPHITSFSF